MPNSFFTLAILLAVSSLGFGGDFVFMVNSGCDFGPMTLTHAEGYPQVQVTPKNCDTLFKKQDWQTAPQVQAPNVSASHLHLLLMLDPDGPKPEPGVFYFHWAVANIPGRALIGNFVGSHDGGTLLSYKGPNPPKGSGQHRYVFLLYEQDDNSTIREKPEKRSHFDLGCWLNPLSKRHPLTGPVAGSQFRIISE